MTRKNKYGNTRISNVFGRFDSVKEWKRYVYLLDQQKRGKIKNLKRQEQYELIPNQRTREGVLVYRKCCYLADFVYEEGEQTIVEDVKSEITRKNPEYIIKKKLMLFVHGIIIKEV